MRMKQHKYVVVTSPNIGRIDTWKLSPECNRIAAPIARKLGIKTEELLRAISRREFAAPPEMPCDAVPVGFSVTPTKDKQLWRRVERAAGIDKTTAEEFIWRAIASYVDCTEESMILHPESNKAIGDKAHLWPFCHVQFADRLFPNKGI